MTTHVNWSAHDYRADDELIKAVGDDVTKTRHAFFTAFEDYAAASRNASDVLRAAKVPFDPEFRNPRHKDNVHYGDVSLMHAKGMASLYLSEKQHTAYLAALAYDDAIRREANVDDGLTPDGKRHRKPEDDR